MKTRSSNLRLLMQLLLFILITGTTSHYAISQSDPGTPGSHGYTRVEYNLGDTAYAIPAYWDPGTPVELRASVHYPTDLLGSPYPLLVFLHGRHEVCYDNKTREIYDMWPCTLNGKNAVPILSYQGYDYVSQILASQGFVVLSISANAINANDDMDALMGQVARAELVAKHLNLLYTFNNGTNNSLLPTAQGLIGKIDFSRIGLMGHSRGGEGVIFAYTGYGTFKLNSNYVIKGVVPLAPTDYLRPVANNVPLMSVLPYCDGNLPGLPGIHYYDDARYNVLTDNSPKHYLLVMGGNHDFYNTMWSPSGGIPGSGDDWLTFDILDADKDPWCGTVAGNGRLTETQQRGTGIAYLTAFFRTYVNGENFVSYLTGDSLPPPSANVPPSPIPYINPLYLTYHAGANSRLDVNRFLDQGNLTTNNLGGTESFLLLNPSLVCGNINATPAESASCLPGQPVNVGRQPHTDIYPGQIGLSQWKTGWTAAANWTTNTKSGQSIDVSKYKVLQFRVSVDYSSSNNAANTPQQFSVALSNNLLVSASVVVNSTVSKALYYPPGSQNTGNIDGKNTGPLPKVVLNTVRIPLSSFKSQNPSLDLTKITSVQINFGLLQGSPLTGQVLVDDVAFSQ